MGTARPVCWVDGRLRDRREAAVRADDSAFAEGRGCYTSARIARGRVRFEQRHVRRLQRGAEALGLGTLDPRMVRMAFADLARAAFDDGEGIVRVELSRDADGVLHVVGVPRGVGHDPPTWSAITAPLPHEGPILAGGHKLTNRLVLALASDAAGRAGVDEALLFDRQGRLVEATRSNVVVLRADGLLVTPPLERGAVAGVAREVLVERLPELRERDVDAADLGLAREIVAINSVRGARPIVRLDGVAVGGGHEALPQLAKALEPDDASRW
jgi:branched-subunit amino acid aminotransferase/4-amino-4-deoxychorismate lyase